MKCWETIADWLKANTAYMENPLVNIDGEAMERNVAESYKIISKCYRTFAEMPGSLLYLLIPSLAY